MGMSSKQVNKMPPRKRISSSLQDPSKMKVRELREELEMRGLDASGKKGELVARLEEALKGS